MKYRILANICRINILVALLSLLFQCTPLNKNFNSGIASNYSGNYVLTLDKLTIKNGLMSIFNTFGDSICTDTISYLWNLFNDQFSKNTNQQAEPLVSNISVMAKILKNNGYTVSRLQPPTYEGVCAISKLPVLLWTIIITYPKEKNNFILDKSLNLDSISLMSQYEDKISIHLISNITNSENSYVIRTTDGLVLHGLKTDNLNKQILPVKIDKTSQYFQVIDCLIVSSLPVVELYEHINEWYRLIPYRNIKPNIIEL